MLNNNINASSAPYPARIALEGRFVTVTPLDPKIHAQALFDQVGGPGNDDLWTYMGDGPFANRGELESNLRLKAGSEDPLFFCDRRPGQWHRDGLRVVSANHSRASLH